MPLVSEQSTVGLPIGQAVERAEPERPPVSETIKAAFRRENSLVSALRRQDLNRQFDAQIAGVEMPDRGDFDPVEYVQQLGMEAYADELLAVDTQAEMDELAFRIRAEEKDLEVLSQSGTLGLAAVFGAAAMDPITLFALSLPGGRETRTAAFVRSATQVALGEASAEFLLQEAQELRTGTESAINIGAATFLGGVLGSFRRGIDDEVFESWKQAVDADLDTRSVGAAQAAEVTPEATQIRGLAKVATAKGIKSMSPLTRLMSATSSKVREIAVSLMETPIGGVMGRLPIAAETNIKAWDAWKAQAVRSVRTAYKNYAKRVPRSQRLSKDEFRAEVTRAMRRGDNHDIPEIAGAAKSVRPLFNRTKDALQEAGFADEFGEVQFAESYVPRVYNHIAVREGQVQLHKQLTDKFAEGGTELAEAQGSANETIRNILGINANNVGPWPGAKPGAAKGRKLAIRDEELEPWLFNDIEYIISRHVDSVAPAVEIQKKFGSVDMADQIQAIKDDYGVLIARNPDRAAKLNREMERAIRDVEGVRDVLLGTYAIPKDPTSAVTRAGAVLRKVNYIRLLGGMTLSAIPDIANFVMRKGLTANFRTFGKMFQDLGRVKASRADLTRAGVGLDLTLNGRAKAWADVGDSWVSRGDAYMDRATEAFSRWTLMSPWNSVMKTWAGFLSQDLILRAGKSVTSGRGISKSMRRQLNNLGLDDDMLRRIWKQTGQHGEVTGGLNLSRTNLWDDVEAATALDRAILKDADITIVTPGAADLPLAMRTNMGRVIGQFRSFAFAATNRMLYSGLQKNDLAVYNGILLSVSLGTLTHIVKSWNAGWSISYEPEDLIANGLDRSGFLGTFMEVNNTMEKATGGRFGISALTGGTPMSRYASRDWIGAAIGPSFGTVSEVGKLGYAASKGEFTPKDTHTARKLLPYNNVFYLRWLFNQAESGVNNTLGIEE